jgi:serine/threonine protein kinase
MQAILEGKYPVPRGISSEGRDLVRRLFAKKADDRISIAQIKRHPWFLQNLPDELSVSQFAGRCPLT